MAGVGDDGAGLGDEGDSVILAIYDIVEKLGEGMYGKVYKAYHKVTREARAIKKISISYEDEGVPSTAIREVSLLKECDHPNIIRLHDVQSSLYSLYLVFEMVDMDLKVFLKTHGPFNDPMRLRNAAYQCFSGVNYFHRRRILHRDIKPQNVLIDVQTRRLKIADFGLARAFSVPLRAYTHEVVTLWYRAPEILLGQSKYATPMDIWSLGCIVAEMATGEALFRGDSEIGTIFQIFQILGTPTEEIWPGVASLRDFRKAFPVWRDSELRDVRQDGPGLGDSGIDLLRTCLKYNPIDRLAASTLLQHSFFASATCHEMPELTMACASEQPIEQAEASAIEGDEGQPHARAHDVEARVLIIEGELEQRAAQLRQNRGAMPGDEPRYMGGLADEPVSHFQLMQV